MASLACGKVLALGRRDDPHIRETFSCLEGRALTSIFDFTEDGARFSVGFDEGAVEATFGDLKVSSAEPVVIWPRIKPPRPIHLSTQMVDDATYRIGQWISSLFSALPLFGERQIFNAGAYQGARRAKPYQIQVAREVGFATPATLVTNSITELERIGSDSLVFKPVNELVHEAAGRPLTTGFNLEELIRLTDAVEAHPAIYQSRVAGVREWRVHVFGDEVFAFHQPGVELDCDRADVRRRGSTQLQPSPEGLADDVSEKCRAFLARMRWDIGVFDLIEMQDGAFVFVECNHDGQWYWAVDRFQTPLPAALADVFDHKLALLSREISGCSSAQSSR